jgi:hypothetical protein
VDKSATIPRSKAAEPMGADPLFKYVLPVRLALKPWAWRLARRIDITQWQAAGQL